MDKRGKCTILYLGAAGLISLVCSLESGAAVPAASEGQVKRSTIAAARLSPPAEAAMEKPQRLDLRLPDISSGDRLGDRPTEQHVSFASFSRHDLASMREEREATQSQYAAPLRTERTLSRTEILANQFRRQGLPVARLWENDSALVHLGLNQKGKPGLWIVQKVR